MVLLSTLPWTTQVVRLSSKDVHNHFGSWLKLLATLTKIKLCFFGWKLRSNFIYKFHFVKKIPKNSNLQILQFIVLKIGVTFPKQVLFLETSPFRLNFAAREHVFYIRNKIEIIFRLHQLFLILRWSGEDLHHTF